MALQPKFRRVVPPNVLSRGAKNAQIKSLRRFRGVARRYLGVSWRVRVFRQRCANRRSETARKNTLLSPL